MRLLRQPLCFYHKKQEERIMDLPGSLEKREGEIFIGGCRVEELSQEYGTPLLIMDEETIREKCRFYQDTMEFSYSEYNIYYASKAFLNMGICRIIEEEGMGLDVVSGGELYTALSADFPADRIIMHGNNKSRRDIIQAIQAGIRAIVIDNEQELKTVENIGRAMGSKVPVMLRVVPALEAITHPHLQTGMGSKFGFKMHQGQAQRALEQVSQSETMFPIGLHCHLGSQITDSDIYHQAAEEVLKLAAQYRHVWKEGLALNLGGGFAVAHSAGEEKFSFDRFLPGLASRVNQLSQELDIPRPVLEFEPGRSIVAPAGMTVYTLGASKEVEGLGTLIPVDGGMSDNIRPTLYDASYHAFVVNKDAQDRPQQKVTITGRLCESGDILIRDIELPQSKPGELLAVTCTGAYTYPMASNYNGLPRPGVVLVNNGRASTLIKGETYEDLLQRQEIPVHLQKERDQYMVL